MMSFFDRLERRIERVDSILCVGLDPVPERLPHSVADAELPRWAFNRRVIDATHEHVAAFKPNIAFYEDVNGWRALGETIAYAAGKDVPVLIDAKRGDIGHTARQYTKLLDGDPWDLQEATPDAITVNPFLGEDAIRPFLDREEKGIFVLCRTSNPGGADLQNRELASGKLVYEHLADRASDWNTNENVGLVVGATAPEELETIRGRVPELPFLVPGVGAQGGDMEAAAKYGPAAGVGLINATRSVIFAGEGTDAPFAATGEAAKRLKRGLNRFRD